MKENYQRHRPRRERPLSDNVVQRRAEPALGAHDRRMRALHRRVEELLATGARAVSR